MLIGRAAASAASKTVPKHYDKPFPVRTRQVLSILEDFGMSLYRRIGRTVLRSLILLLATDITYSQTTPATTSSPALDLAPAATFRGDEDVGGFEAVHLVGGDGDADEV
jgi:hypothetical protein